MGSKIILSAVALIFIVVGVVPLLVKRNIADIKPLVTLPKVTEQFQKSPVSTQSAGQALEFPLQAPEGFKVGIFAAGLGGPRDLEFSPAGTLLVSIPSQGKVVALQSGNSTEVISGLNSPHGLAFYNKQLFIAEKTRLARYHWDEPNLKATLDKELFKIPYVGGHSSRTIVFDSNGQMFVSIGSSCNVCVEDSPFLASVILSNSEGNSPKVFAKGLRNAPFLALNSQTNEVWVTEMGRDNLGDNVPPDEINILKEADFGWPYCYDERVHDNNFDPQNKFNCQNTIVPTFKIQAHSAPLGLAFINSTQFPTDWQGDLLVSYHGSWNRSVKTGYKVVRLKVDGNSISSQEDFITGFLEGSTVNARPVDLIFDKAGSLYISDDKAGYIFKVIQN